MTDKDGSNRQGDLPGQIEADVRCVNAHDRCFMGGPCPYCETICHRDAQGRFSSAIPTDTATTASAVGTERSGVNQNNQVIP